ncbi:MAG: crossover junction endodeoxyribonuclease RuvC [Oscillospiraceae bacterium]|jgi:crossover junction endodeoxyribonuclease RuvC|nr:crossover junction endodeoxyribonuclease RuvC [Oscillospiraceae bacterium]
MIILGIDPGYAITGYGVVETSDKTHKLATVDYGAVTTLAGTYFPTRLKEIYDDISFILDKHKPDAMSIERLFFTNNQKTGIDTAEARGIILLAAVKRNVPIYEYTPLQVKSAVTGYGKAVKKQVQEMTRSLLGLKEIPKPDDTADALAIAICCAHSIRSRQ